MPSDNNHHIRVLLVDDEDKILRFLALKLKFFDYDVTTAPNGRDALTLLKSTNHDIIVLDILMPIMDSFEVLQELRTFSALPVVVLSAKSDNAERAMELGANDFISKPFKPDELVASIEANLNHRASHTVNRPIVKVTHPCTASQFARESAAFSLSFCSTIDIMFCVVPVFAVRG